MASLNDDDDANNNIFIDPNLLHSALTLPDTPPIQLTDFKSPKLESRSRPGEFSLEDIIIYLRKQQHPDTTTVYKPSEIAKKYSVKCRTVIERELKKYTIDEKEQIRLAIEVDQRSQEWHRLRANRVTASRFNSITGNNPYQDAKKCLEDMLYHTFQGNKYTQYGVKNEPVARKAFETYMKKTHSLNSSQFKIYLPGFYVPLHLPWIGVSVDGIILNMKEKSGRELGLLEIKCPYKQKTFGGVPDMYKDQIQGSMNLLNLPWCAFVCWTPTLMEVTIVERDMDYWKTTLYPSLENFFITQFLPRLLLQKKQSPSTTITTTTIIETEEEEEEDNYPSLTYL